MADYTTLKQKAQEVRNENKVGANTANRVGYVLEETVKAVEAEEQRARQAEAQSQSKLDLYHEEGTEAASIGTHDRVHIQGKTADNGKIVDLYISAEELLALLQVTKGDEYVSSIKINGKSVEINVPESVTITAPDGLQLNDDEVALKSDLTGKQDSLSLYIERAVKLDGEEESRAEITADAIKFQNATNNATNISCSDDEVAATYSGDTAFDEVKMNDDGVLLQSVGIESGEATSVFLQPDGTIALGANSISIGARSLNLTEAQIISNGNSYTFPEESGIIGLKSDVDRKQDKLEQYKEHRININGAVTTTASIDADRINIQHTGGNTGISCSEDAVSAIHSGEDVYAEVRNGTGGISLHIYNKETDVSSGINLNPNGIVDIEGDAVKVNGVELKNTTIINDLTTGGADKALSADMGKALSAELAELESELGTELRGGTNIYALKEGCKYFVKNKGVQCNVGYYKGDNYILISELRVDDIIEFIAPESADNIYMSAFDNVRAVIWNESNNIAIGVSAKMEANSINRYVSGTLLNRKTNYYNLIKGETYLLKNNSDVSYGVGYYVGTEYVLIKKIDIGESFTFTPQESIDNIYISDIVGAKCIIYRVLEQVKKLSLSINEKLHKYNPKSIIVSNAFIKADTGELAESKNYNAFIYNVSPKCWGGTLIATTGANSTEDASVAFYINRSTSPENCIKTVRSEDGVKTYTTEIPQGATTIVVSTRPLLYSEESVEIIATEPILGVEQCYCGVESIRVAAYNVGNYSGIDKPNGSQEARMAYRNLLAHDKPMIVAVQADVDKFGDMEAKEEIWRMFRMYEQRGTSDYNYKAFASDIDLYNIRQINFTGASFNHGYFLAGQIYVNGMDILVISFHLDWADKNRRALQYQQIVNYTDAYTNAIVMGDTNCENYENSVLVDNTVLIDEWKIFKEHGFVMTNNGYFGLHDTFGLGDNAEPLDNIFVKGNITITNFEVVREDWMNDHNLLIADLSISNLTR